MASVPSLVSCPAQHLFVASFITSIVIMIIVVIIIIVMMMVVIMNNAIRQLTRIAVPDR